MLVCTVAPKRNGIVCYCHVASSSVGKICVIIETVTIVWIPATMITNQLAPLISQLASSARRQIFFPCFLINALLQNVSTFVKVFSRCLQVKYYSLIASFYTLRYTTIQGEKEVK